MNPTDLTLYTQTRSRARSGYGTLTNDELPYEYIDFNPNPTPETQAQPETQAEPPILLHYKDWLVPANGGGQVCQIPLRQPVKFVRLY